jgi:hypothetical protein
MSSEKFIKLVKAFWQKHEYKTILLFGFILVSFISFEAGVLKGEKWQKEPLVIEKLVSTGEAINTAQKPPEASKLASGGQNTEIKANTSPAECAFVGSKNSNKYHLSSCQWAKRIKPENIVCFKSAEDAVQKGYQPDKSCIK